MTAGNGRTVLLVEDDASVRKLVSSILGSRGYHILSAAGGTEAIRLAESHAGEIHLIVSDFGLADMNGLEAAARIAGDRPGIGILLISGYTDLPLSPDLRGAIRAEFLSKPFTMDSLLAKVGKMLEVSRPGD